MASSNSYDQLIAQLRTKLNRQEGALAATRLHIEAIEKLKASETKNTSK